MRKEKIRGDKRKREERKRENRREKERKRGNRREGDKEMKSERNGLPLSRVRHMFLQVLSFYCGKEGSEQRTRRQDTKIKGRQRRKGRGEERKREEDCSSL